MVQFFTSAFCSSLSPSTLGTAKCLIESCDSLTVCIIEVMTFVDGTTSTEMPLGRQMVLFHGV